MPANDAKPRESELQNEEALEQAVYEAMKSLGWIIPQIPEDVEKSEAELAKHPIEIPARLRDAEAVFRETSGSRCRAPVPPTDFVSEENLARVAREGAAVPPEIEERMRRDREAAEHETSND